MIVNKMSDMYELLTKIPKIDVIFQNQEWKRISKEYAGSVLKTALNNVLDTIREKIKNGELHVVPTVEEIINETEKKVREIISARLKRVINATGVIVHTNLGRSILPKRAVEAIMNASSHYTNLEYNLEEGKRGDRYVHCSEILQRLTGSDDAIVVNNNAAAVYLVLNTLAEGKEVIVSRGELVEIGGSFRIPDVMRKSGAIIKEVGTTNRTYLRDYEEAISPNTALIMKVHTSNFIVKGFTKDVTSDELILLSNRYNIPFYYDTGSGLFCSIEPFSDTNEPHVPNESKKGVDILSFSGDKLLGGPQAGIIVGKKEYIERMKKNPLIRALRPDKMTLAGLEATLLLYLDQEKAKMEIPTLKMAICDVAYLKKRTRRIIKNIKREYGDADIMSQSLYSEMGGGSFPELKIPSYGFSICPKKISVNTFEKIIRSLEVPIVARIEKERLVFDMRTVLEEDERVLVSEIVRALKEYDTDG